MLSDAWRDQVMLVSSELGGRGQEVYRVLGSSGPDSRTHGSKTAKVESKLLRG